MGPGEENVNMSRIDKGSGVEGTARLALLVRRAAAQLRACRDGLQSSIDVIRGAMDMPHTRGSTFSEFLRIKVEALENLRSLCNTVAGRLSNGAAELMRGKLDKKLLDEILMISRFAADQLRSEQRDAVRILNMLRAGGGPGCGGGQCTPTPA